VSTFVSRRSPERAFESLYRRHAGDVYRYSLALLDRQTDAEDATQNTFLNAYRALARGERPRDAGRWLRAIALNVCREHHRRAARRPDEVSLNEDPGELVLDPPAPQLDDLLRGLSALAFNQRAALVMRELEGRSLAEIASELGVSSSAVETLLFRARRALREQLEETLTCSEAERAISRQLDGALPRAERGPLRAHLRVCPDCAALARRVRAQRGAMRSLALAIPLPVSLRLPRLLGGGAASGPAIAGSASASAPLLAGLGAKLAVLAVAGAAVVGAGWAARSGQTAGTHRHAPASRAASRLGARHGTPAARVMAASPTALVARAAARRIAAAHLSRGTGYASAGDSRGRALGQSHRAYGGSQAGHGNPSAGHGNPSAGHSNPTASHGNPTASHGKGHAYGLTKPRPTQANGNGASGGLGTLGNGAPAGRKELSALSP
jgi:RNA polymerase sigma factor (sigma-70 family)